METIGLACLYGLTAMDDLKTKQVRVLEIIVFGILGIIINIIYKPHTLISVLGGVGIGLLTILFSYISKEKIGMGDAYIITVTGLYLGFIDTGISTSSYVVIAAHSLASTNISVRISDMNNGGNYRAQLIQCAGNGGNGDVKKSGDHPNIFLWCIRR